MSSSALAPARRRLWLSPDAHERSRDASMKGKDRHSLAPLFFLLFTLTLFGVRGEKLTRSYTSASASDSTSPDPSCITFRRHDILSHYRRYGTEAVPLRDGACKRTNKHKVFFFPLGQFFARTHSSLSFKMCTFTAALCVVGIGSSKYECMATHVLLAKPFNVVGGYVRVEPIRTPEKK